METRLDQPYSSSNFFATKHRERVLNARTNGVAAKYRKSQNEKAKGRDIRRDQWSMFCTRERSYCEGAQASPRPEFSFFTAPSKILAIDKIDAYYICRVKGGCISETTLLRSDSFTVPHALLHRENKRRYLRVSEGLATSAGHISSYHHYLNYF